MGYLIRVICFPRTRWQTFAYFIYADFWHHGRACRRDEHRAHQHQRSEQEIIRISILRLMFSTSIFTNAALEDMTETFRVMKIL